MNNLKIFRNESFGEVRVVEQNGEPWFVGKDVAVMLGYSDTAKALKQHVDSEDKLTGRFVWSGQNRQMYVINESGLYSLILSSKLPTAKQFKRWVTSEILPTIRKHGAYMTADKLEEVIADPDSWIVLLQTLKTERERAKALEAQAESQKQIIGELQDKANYVDSILASKSLVTITQIAKDYGMSGAAMNDLLWRLHVQYKQSGQWLLYSKYQSKGYTNSHTIKIKRSSGLNDVVMETKWTQTGRVFLYELLKKYDYLPTVEKE